MCFLSDVFSLSLAAMEGGEEVLQMYAELSQKAEELNLTKKGLVSLCGDAM